MRFHFWQPCVVLLVVLLLIWPHGVSDGNSTPVDPLVQNQGADVIAVETKIEKPQPPSGFVLLFTGNWLGQIEPCGCSEKQLGGIDRRNPILNAIPTSSRLLVDAGPLVDFDDKEKQQSQAQSQLKFETFLFSLKHLKYDAICLSGDELLIKNEMKLSDHSPLVVTNMKEEAREKFGALGYLEKTLVVGEHRLDCLVLSLARELSSSAPDHQKKLLQLQESVTAVKGMLVSRQIDPEEAAPNKLIVVTMSEKNKGLAEKLQQIPAIDVIVTLGAADEPEKCETKTGPVMVTTGRMGKYITRIDVPLTYAGESGQLYFKQIAIEEEFEKDPVIVSRIDDYQLQMQMEQLVEDETKIVRQSLEGGNRFVGNASCGAADCHEEIYKKWREFRHGYALATLEKVNRQYDPTCVACHTVGMAYESGYRSREKTPNLADVGCEMCHGPGEKHEQDVYEEYEVIFTSCEQCHDHESSPKFEKERVDYFKKIEHWTEPREYWE